ncbi:MAG: sodium-dependent transporter [Paludibacteraceae bacterium]|nr:sodium-dependent transporter [Paludibacteraceae bacterium]
MSEKERISFGSKLGVVAAAAGSAVGLGNIWRFPYELGQYGGGAFLVIYLLCVLLLGMPVMMSEFVIGRMGQANTAGSFRKLAPGKKWWIVGLMGVLASFLILGFYIVVAGWTLEYVVQAVGDRFSGRETATLAKVFADFSTDTFRPLLWMALFTILTGGVVYAGVKNGIEKSTKFLMPLLLLIIIALGVRSVTLPGGAEGLRFLFQPDFSKINSSVILSAMGQAFFSLSLGMGCMITYGSYISKKNNLQHTVVEVTVLDTLIAVLASIAIFPAVFSLGINPAQGPELVFITLPNVFAHMPGGYFWAILFFVLLAVAALTSTISLLEVIVAYVVEEFGFKRHRVIALVSVAVLFLGLLSSFSLGIWSDVKIFGMGFFTLFDNATSKILMPVGGLFIAVFVGWSLDKNAILNEMSNEGKIKVGYFRLFMFLVRYLAPIGIGLIIINQLGFGKLLSLE